MAPTRTGFNCPRCGELLPSGVDRCDACGAYIVPTPAAAAQGPAPAAHGPATAPVRGRVPLRAQGAPAPAGGRMNSTAALMLVVGLLVGGAVGYALKSASSPDTGDGGAPMGPADMMGGGGGMGGMGGGTPGGMGEGAPAGGSGAAGMMSSDVMQRVQEYRATLAKDPKNLEANIGLGNLLFDSSQWQKAIDHYGAALEVDPKNADVRVDMAICLHSLGENERAKKEMERVTREQPNHKNAWFNLGVVTMTLGDTKGAVRAWEQYLKLDPNGERSASLRDEVNRLKKVP